MTVLYSLMSLSGLLTDTAYVLIPATLGCD